MISKHDFPRLTEQNHRVTSPPSPDYNCIAWAAGDAGRWWQPGRFWPVETAPGGFGIETLEQAFLALGYEVCADGSPEPDHEKVALYASSLFYTHAARQLSTGRWTSKLGRSEDIEHDAPEDVAGGVYGEVVRYLRRPLSGL